jgi:hypothetical protein
MLPPAAQIDCQKCMQLESALGDRLTSPVKRCTSVPPVNCHGPATLIASGPPEVIR